MRDPILIKFNSDVKVKSRADGETKPVFVNGCIAFGRRHLLTRDTYMT